MKSLEDPGLVTHWGNIRDVQELLYLNNHKKNRILLQILKNLCANQKKEKKKKAKKTVCQLYITSKETERFDASVNSKELFALRKTRLQFLSL